MSALREKLAAKIPAMRQRAKDIVSNHGEKVISEVTVAQAFGGMRGVKCMVCDTSVVDAQQGLIIRGIPIGDLAARLPEEIFFLLCTGDLPDDAELKSLQAELRDRRAVPDYVWNVLRALPLDTHPMQMFEAAILILERESVFHKRYTEGMTKQEHWEPALEDALSLIAKLPALAAAVYRIRFEKGDLIEPDPSLDWGASFAQMLGVPDPTGKFAELMRLYMTLHSDHEGGNVSANTCHVVGSSLADPYYAVSAGLGGLAGPLHGLANQECLRFVNGVKDRFGDVPTEQQMTDYVWEVLKSGRVIPGYGHAVLRVTDPRFAAFHAFGERVLKDDPLFRIVDMGFRLIPDILKQHGKAKSPYPNVDAVTGSLVHHFGITESNYYTVLFGVSRSLGMLSQLILNRALGTAITRPKSVSMDWIEKQVNA
jgi:citrate synthase